MHNQKKRRCAVDGFTLLEVFIVIVMVFILIVLLLPSLAGSHRNSRKSLRIKCASNLKQVGMAFRTWEEDNHNYPMGFLTNNSGAPLYSDSANMYRYLLVMSNELSNPYILVCPMDKKHSPATNFTLDLNSSHISYFVGLDSGELRPQSFLAGDSNITNSFHPKNGLVELTTNQAVGWTSERHNEVGNVLLGDGSVQQWNSPGLNGGLRQTGLATNRLLFPP